MAYSYIEYNSNSSANSGKDYIYSFSAVTHDTANIKITVGGTTLSTSLYSIVEGTVTLSAAPGSGSAPLDAALSTTNVMRIFRQSNRTSAEVVFSSASVLQDSDLNTANDQGRFLALEAIDRANESITIDESDASRYNVQVDSADKRIYGIADPVDDKDAVNKGFLSGNLDAIAAVNSNLADVEAVAGKTTEIDIIVNKTDGSSTSEAGTNKNIAQVDVVADAVDAVNTVAGSAYKALVEVVGESTYKGKVEIVADSTYKGEVETLADSTYKGQVETVAGSSYKTDVETVAESTYKGQVETVAGSTYKTKVEAVADNVTNVNTFANTYLGAVDGGTDHASAPTTNRTTGDLYYNTNSSLTGLFVYNGSVWENLKTAVDGNTITSADGSDLNLTTDADGENVVINDSTGSNYFKLPNVRGADAYVLTRDDTEGTGGTSWKESVIPPTIGSLTYPTESGVVATALEASGGTDDNVMALTITTAGTGYSGSGTLLATGGAGNGFAGTYTESGGAIATVTITDPGQEYTSTPTIVVSGSTSGTPAVITASLNETLLINGADLGSVSNPPTVQILVGVSYVTFAGTVSCNDLGTIVTCANVTKRASGDSQSLKITHGSNGQSVTTTVNFSADPSFSTASGSLGLIFAGTAITAETITAGGSVSWYEGTPTMPTWMTHFADGDTGASKDLTGTPTNSTDAETQNFNIIIRDSENQSHNRDFSFIVATHPTFSGTSGVINTVGDYKYYYWLSAHSGGSLVVYADMTVEILLVGGGGSGGSGTSGGGGAGGLIYISAFQMKAGTYEVTVGGGGTQSSTNAVGDSGDNSVFTRTIGGSNILTAIGGGGGGAYNGSAYIVGTQGGSAGGQFGYNIATTAGNTALTPTSPFTAAGGNITTGGVTYNNVAFGNNGGTQYVTANGGAGGGGGAGGVGANGGAYNGGSTTLEQGGLGKDIASFNHTVWDISASSDTSYAAGGGGQNADDGTTAASGIGGIAPASISASAPNPGATGGALANTGSGGGGTWNHGEGVGGDGSSGIVILRYSLV